MNPPGVEIPGRGEFQDSEIQDLSDSRRQSLSMQRATFHLQDKVLVAFGSEH